MGGSYDEEEFKWRKKGQRIGNMTPDEIKKSLNKTFFAIQEDLRYEYGHRGYTGTLAEKDGAFITYLPNLTDNELKKLKNWIQNFEKMSLIGKLFCQTKVMIITIMINY